MSESESSPEPIHTLHYLQGDTAMDTRTGITPARHCPWVEELTDHFDELVKLSKGWDGYGGKPVALECRQFAEHILETLYVEAVPTPQVVPGYDGSLQLEWHCGQFDVELHILAKNKLIAYRFDHLNHQDEVEDGESIEIETDFSILNKWMKDLHKRVA